MRPGVEFRGLRPQGLRIGVKVYEDLTLLFNAVGIYGGLDFIGFGPMLLSSMLESANIQDLRLSLGFSTSRMYRELLAQIPGIQTNMCIHICTYRQFRIM